MNLIKLSIEQVEKDPENIGGRLRVRMQANGNLLTESLFASDPRDVEMFRREMVRIELELSAGIEAVREILETLPATSIESAKCPLLLSEAV